MAKVKAYVYVLVSGVSTLLRPGDTVPEGVVIKNPDALDEGSVIRPLPAPAPTPAPAKKAPAARKAPAADS